MTSLRYMDLYLEKISDNGESKHFVLSEILELSRARVIVVLGAPGSGKSALLKKYQSETAETTELLTVNHFIKLEKTTEKSVLLLDGLDEFRSTSADKVFVINELGSKISKLQDIRVVVSCREMDWYGEDDKYALKSEIKSDVDVYRILPLSYEKQIELAGMLGLDEPQKFVDSLTEKGLISNPQMLIMMADIFKEYNDLETIGKGELYKRYVLFAREHNKNYERNGSNNLSEDEIFRLGGYLALFYIFSNVDIFDDNMLDKMQSVDFPFDKLKIVVGSKLFPKKKFNHRTIAEFLAGNYIARYLLEASDGIGMERVKALFANENKIPTELRGTFAWLCSISKNPLLIQIDPYYQAIHGDNSLFDVEQKKEIVLSVKKYAEDSPYFYKFNHSLDLQGFYDERLEGFFIAELKEALRLKNHYIYFVCAILKGADGLGDNLRSVIKSSIIDNSIVDYYRDNLVHILNDENNFLLEVLEKIKGGGLDDDSDCLKEALLDKLYPSVIDSKNVWQYLRLYHGESHMGGCHFLQQTPYSEKKDLVDEIHNFSIIKEGKNKHLIIKDRLKLFVSKYFLETALKYEDGLSAEDIYEILKYFKTKYYDKYQPIELDMYGWIFKEKLDVEKKQKLANELYRLYIKDKINNSVKRYYFHDFNYFFNLENPNNQFETLLGFMDEKLDKHINEDLFFAALAYSKRDENNKPIEIDKILGIAKAFDLEEEFERWLNPPKQDWQIEQEKKMVERTKKDKETLDANEDYFANRSDEEIQKSFDDLSWFHNLVYFEEEQTDTKLITTDTYSRLRKIFKNAIFAELIEPELLNIKHLAQDKGGRRNIDRVYYASLALNNDCDIVSKIQNREFLKYLYILSLLSSDIININRSNFHDKVDKSFAVEVSKEYIESLVSCGVPDIKDMVIKYIKDTDDMDLLKNIATTREFNNLGFESAFVSNFLDAFNFSIAKDDLAQLKKYAEGGNKATIEALEYFANKSSEEFSMSMAVAMYTIFSYNKFQTFYSYPERAIVIGKMMEAFNTEESIKSVNGIQSQKNVCASFLTDIALNVLNIDECKVLLQNHQSDIWTNRIKNAIDDKGQQQVDSQGYGKFNIAVLKEFLQGKAIVSVNDFFADVCIRLEALVQKIEDNRDNEKNRFYNKTDPKDENGCRDIVKIDLELLYSNEWVITRERHEADNRVDINIKYKKCDNYEIQIECKKDENPKVYAGIEEQLIGKYLSSKVQYGIYLIFYFGQNHKDEFLKKLNESVPQKYKNKIKIILLDLTK